MPNRRPRAPRRRRARRRGPPRSRSRASACPTSALRRLRRRAPQYRSRIRPSSPRPKQRSNAATSRPAPKSPSSSTRRTPATTAAPCGGAATGTRACSSPRVACVVIEGPGFAAAARNERHGAAASIISREPHDARRAANAVAARVRAATNISSSGRAESAAVAVRRGVGRRTDRHARVASVVTEGPGFATAARSERRGAATSATSCEHRACRAANAVAARARAATSTSHSGRAEPAAAAVRRDNDRQADHHVRAASAVVEGPGFAAAARNKRRDAAARIASRKPHARRVANAVAARVRAATSISSSGRAEPAAVAVRPDVDRRADREARVASVVIEGPGFAAAARGGRRGASVSIISCEHRACRAANTVAARVRAATSISSSGRAAAARHDNNRRVKRHVRAASAVVEGPGLKRGRVLPPLPKLTLQSAHGD